MDLRFHPSSDQSCLKFSLQVMPPSPSSSDSAKHLQTHTILFISEPDNSLSTILKASLMRSAELKADLTVAQTLHKKKVKIGDYKAHE